MKSTQRGRGIPSVPKTYSTPSSIITTRRSERLSSITKGSAAQTHSQESEVLLDDDTQVSAKKGVSKALEFSKDGAENEVARATKKGRLSKVVELGSISSLSQLETNTVQSSVAPGELGFPKSDGNSNDLRCAALELCIAPWVNLETVSKTCICVNCNFTAHLECAEQLFVQRPKKDGPIDYYSHLSREVKERVKTFDGDRDNIMICNSCMSSIEGRIKPTRQPAAPTKGKKSTFEKIMKRIVYELRMTAIFHALVFVYKSETKKNDDKMRYLRELFYGTADKKGTAQQLIDGDGPFKHLYVVNEGVDGNEMILQPDFYAVETAMSLVVGRDIKLLDLTTIGSASKQLADTTLWAHATKTLKSCKKAMTLVARLAPKMIQLDASKRVVGYSSGITFKSFMRAVNNGMYRLGDDESFIRESNKKTAADDDDDIRGPQQKDAADWDPFDGVEAPDEFMFHGYIAFALLGPAAVDPNYFSLLLRTNTDVNRSKEERNQVSRAAARKNNAKAEEVSRQDRRSTAINMQTNCDIATIALAKAEADERATDRKFLALTAELDAKRLEIDVVAKLLVGCDDDEELAELRESLKTLRKEVRQLTVELGEWKKHDSEPVEFVNNLLDNAKTMMGGNAMKNDSGEGDEEN